MFYFSFVLLAIGTSGCMGLVTMTAVAQWFEKDVGKAFGIMSSAFGASGLIIPLIVWLTDAFHWRTALIILAVGMWALGIPLSFVIRDRPERRNSADETGQANHSASSNKAYPPRAVIPIKGALLSRAFVCLIVVEMIRAMVVLGVVTHVMPYLAQTGMSRPRAGLVAAAIPLASIAGRFGLGWFADVFDKKYVMALAYCFMGIGLFAFCFVEAGWAILCFLFFFSTGLGGSMVLRGAILKEYFGSGTFGRLLGILMGSGAIGGIIGPTAAGWVFDTLGNYRIVWFGLLGPLTVSILLVLSLNPRKIERT
jgi:MFS family permease